MAVVDELKRLSAAEDFFRYLAVPFDAAVLDRARLHILKKMGQSLAGARTDGASDEEVRERFRAALEAAYADFVERSPMEERVFKVHKDAKRALLPFARRR